ncbi:MAG: hypothetical protein Q7T49_01135 [bacterium]|nr:hypothetical protein [bacterium]
MDNVDNINTPPVPQSHKSIWLWLVIIVVLASIGLIAYQQGFFKQTATSKTLSPEEAKKINDFLTQTEVPPITEQEAANINKYLVTEPVKPLTPEEKQKILDYLRQ